MLNKVKKVTLKVLAGAGLVATQTGLALAQISSPLPGSNPNPGSFDSVSDTISTLFQVVVAAAGAIFVVLLLVGGIQYLTAAGNEEATAKARRLLVDSIVGLFIVLAAWALGKWILDNLGVGF